MDSNATAKSDFWAERILAFQESGLSRRDWCLKNGISQSTFGYWFRKLQTVDPRTGQGGEPVFVRLPSEREIPSGCAAAHSPVTICLLRNIRIEISADCPAGLLSALLDAVKNYA